MSDLKSLSFPIVKFNSPINVLLLQYPISNSPVCIRILDALGFPCVYIIAVTFMTLAVCIVFFYKGGCGLVKTFSCLRQSVPLNLYYYTMLYVIINLF